MTFGNARLDDGRAELGTDMPAFPVANATDHVRASSGVLPNRDTPVPAGLIRKSQAVADAACHRLWTPLLKAAQEAGATVTAGRELAIHQALDAFRLFTGIDASETAMAQAFDQLMAAGEPANRAA
ncbi:hypothetical protein [Bosea lathyri]|nr:hypothetical protein [Bosea lathyri]